RDWSSDVCSSDLGAPARLNRSAAMGVEPSEHTSIRVAASKVRNRPETDAPNHTPKTSSGTKARINATSTTPNTIQRSTIFESFRPCQNMLSTEGADQSCSPQLAFSNGHTGASLNSV